MADSENADVFDALTNLGGPSIIPSDDATENHWSEIGRNPI